MPSLSQWASFPLVASPIILQMNRAWVRPASSGIVRNLWGHETATCDLACAQPLHSVTGFFLGVWGSGHGKLAKLAHQKALEKSLGKPDLNLTWSCPMLRLSHMVADMTHPEDKLILIPGNAVWGLPRHACAQPLRHRFLPHNSVAKVVGTWQAFKQFGVCHGQTVATIRQPRKKKKTSSLT